MTKIIYLLFLVSLLTLTYSFAHGQTDFYKKGDSLYKIKDYKNSALAYADGIRAEGQAASIGRYRFCAASWALAGEADSAFYYLNIISRSEKANKVIAQNIRYGADFIALQQDKHWQPALNAIQLQAEMNGYPQEEFIYGHKDGIGLTLVQIKPKKIPNGKAILQVANGGFVSSYNGIEFQTASVEQYLAKGYTVFAVMQGSYPRYAIPDQINDIKRAIRYIRYHAAKFGIDPGHMGITGGSSGGHLALAVATADDKINTTAPDPVDRVSSGVQAVAVLFPPTDLLNYGEPGKVFRENTTLYGPVTDTAARNRVAREISPLLFVSPDDPPVFIMHGDADSTVPLQQSQTIIARLNEAGVPNRFIIKKGGKHNGDDMKPEWQEFVDWFDKYLK